MALYEDNDQFAGYPVVVWEPGDPISDPAGSNYKIAFPWWDNEAAKQKWTDRLAQFLEDPAGAQVEGLVVGVWAEGDVDPGEVIEALVAAREKLPALRRLFLGDIASEDNEMSWIRQGDMAPLLAAYPQLEHFGVRGGTNLSFSVQRHDGLRSLEIETGGLGRAVVQQVFAAELPALEHLELWLGAEDYGADTTVADFQPLLAGDLFPNLRYLGLRNSEIADELAVALATAPIVERIEVLDLSLGTLGDAGAEALLTSPAVARLKKLDLHHHYCSKKMMKRLKKLPLEVNIEEQKEPDKWRDEEHRYVMVGE